MPTQGQFVTDPEVLQWRRDCLVYDNAVSKCTNAVNKLHYWNQRLRIHNLRQPRDPVLGALTSAAVPFAEPKPVQRPFPKGYPNRPSAPAHPKAGQRNKAFERWEPPVELVRIQFKATLILVPPTLAGQWGDEFKKFAPSLKVCY
jgi:hypothetical protein